MAEFRYPNESKGYRDARAALLKDEQELIDKVKAVAEKRRKLPRRQRAQDKCAPTPGRGMEMPTRPAGLDPIVAEIIEALARTIIRDEDRRASLPFMSTNG